MSSTTRVLALVLVLPAAAAGCASPFGPGSPVTAQRPTLSVDTNTTAQGTLEIEAGAAIDRKDSLDTPTVVKYGLDERLEVFVGVSPYREIERPGSDGEGFGDTLLGARYRFWQNADGSTSAAAQLALKLSTGSESEGLSTGEEDLLAAGIVTHRVKDTTLTGFYQLGLLGEEDEDSSEVDAQHSLALAATQPLTTELSFFGELALQASPELVDTSFGTFGFAYAVSQSLLIDLGVAVGIDSDAPDLVFLVGLTTNLGRPFRRSPGGR